MKVMKKSQKPFKSGSIVNTVKGICVNKNDPKNRLAYTFVEDGSIVNVEICTIISDE